jgi:hypothetical protein
MWTCRLIVKMSVRLSVAVIFMLLHGSRILS